MYGRLPISSASIRKDFWKAAAAAAVLTCYFDGDSWLKLCRVQLMLNMTEELCACFLCGKSAFVECQECHQAWFCSPEHLEELHQPPKCFPIKVASSEAVGRYLVATRDLAPLDLVLADTATPQGPPHDTMVVCLGCLRPINPSGQATEDEPVIVCRDCGHVNHVQLSFCLFTSLKNDS